jgi:tetratricopeptide (TPR) repeat protein
MIADRGGFFRRSGKMAASLAGLYSGWVCMMMQGRWIGLYRILAVVLLSVCLPAGSLIAGEGPSLSAQDWFERGRFMGEIGNYRKAVVAFSRVIEFVSDSAHAYNNRGVAYSELGNYRLAIQDYNRAIGIDPDEALFRFNRGIAFGRQEEFHLAMTDFAQVLEMEPQHAEARFFLGLIQRGTPGKGYIGVDNIKVSAQMGNKSAQNYLRSRFMGWY